MGLSDWTTIAGAIWRGFTDSRVPFGRRVDVLAGFTLSGLRFAAGTFARGAGPRPGTALVLYDRETDANCRVVREVISELDVEVEIRPCPEGGTRFTGEIRDPVPVLVDPNAGTTVAGRAAVVTYLQEKYGKRRKGALSRSAPVVTLSGAAFRVVRGTHGRAARPSTAPEKPLELWGFEASPFTRLVREKLCELELPYRLKPVAKRSARRPEMIALAGKVQAPWLVDPNTGVRMFESAEIEKYLEATYGRQP